MWKIIKLLLPALIPSWNFFDVIVPSPRIQFSIIKSINDASDWQEFRPRPGHISFLTMLRRMLWNPTWNESLFLVSCAERLLENPTAHSEKEIFKRIKAELVADNDKEALLKFRLLFIHREGDELKEKVEYESQPQVIVEDINK